MPAPLREVVVRLDVLEADRQRKALTLVQLAADSGVNRSVVSDIFNGRRNGLESLKKIADVLGHPIERYLVLPTDKKRRTK